MTNENTAYINDVRFSHFTCALLQPDPAFLQFSMEGPYNSPPIPGYMAKDGNYIDHTNYFENAEIYNEFAEQITNFKKKRGR